LPFYLDHDRKKGSDRRQYCYFTQFAPTLTAIEQGEADLSHAKNRVLMPLVYYLYSSSHTKLELLRMMKSITGQRIKFSKVSAAFDNAKKFQRRAMQKWQDVYNKEADSSEKFHVVLLGRPYHILSKTMNKGIPDILASLGIKTFFQDMLMHDPKALETIQPLLREIHWYYAAEIMKSAVTVARSQHAYPVFVSAFKCSPDSFVIDFFKELMESYAKPYLILQLDEHDSMIGYETRIEAAARSFQNHHATSSTRASLPLTRAPAINMKKGILHKTLVVPNWDTIPLSLVVANLRKEGIDARLMEESQASIQKSLRYNTGQCIPLNIIAQEFIDYMKTRRLDPSRTALWLVKSAIPCNLRLYSNYIKRILQMQGGGYEKAEMYPGVMSFADLSKKLPIDTYFAYMFGGMVKKIGCRIRPYERIHGRTDQVIRESLHILKKAFLGNQSKADAAAEVVSLFEGIETCGLDSTSGATQEKSKVAIFGDLYARDNEMFNQDLIHFIEKHGGEVVTTPYSSYVKMIAKPYLRKWFVEGNYLNALSSRALIAAVTHLEKKYYKYFNRILKEPEPDYDEPPEDILSRYRMRIEHTGESMDNILKIFYTIKHYPDIALFVQTSPAFCCPSMVTEAMAGEIERNTGVPIVSVTYDGTSGDKNDIILPYLKYPTIRSGWRKSHQDYKGVA
jgi:predicted nucleotide-binding protein (sugar kinase/HSP70/actin superfamily)